MIQLHHGDCLVEMDRIADGSVDLILADLPYGTTACKWDTIIPFEPLWKQYKRVIKRNGAIVLTASQPFTSALVMSNPAMFRDEWIWHKSNVTGFLAAKKRPLRQHESILVFAVEPPRYFPQMFVKDKPRKAQRTVNANGVYGAIGEGVFRTVSDELGYPRSVMKFNTAYHERNAGLHPTQKPIGLMEYLIRTYTNEGELVLDNTMGSGTTGVACLNTGRRFIGIEKDAEIFVTAERRIAAAQRERESLLIPA